MPFTYHQGMWVVIFLREGNILCTVELQLSVFLNQNISTLLTFGVKINTFKEAEWQSPAVLAGCLRDIKEKKKNAQCIWKYKSWHFSGVLMDSSRWFFGRMLSHLACFTMSVELCSTCQLLKMWFHKSNKMGKSRSRAIFQPTDT